MDCLEDEHQFRSKQMLEQMTEIEQNAEAFLKFVQPIYIHIKLLSQQTTLYTKVKKFLANKQNESQELILAFDDISGIITPRQLVRYK